MDITGNRVFLRPLTEDHLPILHEWRNSESFINLCSMRRNIVSFEDFQKELRSDFRRDRYQQMIVYRISQPCPIGTIFSYNFNQMDGHVFLTTYIEDKLNGIGYGAEAFFLYGLELFKKFNLYKIYTDIYSYNKLSISTLKHYSFVQEGCFKGHRLFNNQRCDLIRFAFYRENIDSAVKLMQRMKMVK